MISLLSMVVVFTGPFPHRECGDARDECAAVKSTSPDPRWGPGTVLVICFASNAVLGDEGHRHRCPYAHPDPRRPIDQSDCVTGIWTVRISMNPILHQSSSRGPSAENG
jgi:hypothetical protein